MKALKFFMLSCAASACWFAVGCGETKNEAIKPDTYKEQPADDQVGAEENAMEVK